MTPSIAARRTPHTKPRVRVFIRPVSLVRQPSSIRRTAAGILQPHIAEPARIPERRDQQRGRMTAMAHHAKVRGTEVLQHFPLTPQQAADALRHTATELDWLDDGAQAVAVSAARTTRWARAPGRVGCGSR